jgi:hypothetical protein
MLFLVLMISRISAMPLSSAFAHPVTECLINGISSLLIFHPIPAPQGTPLFQPASSGWFRGPLDQPPSGHLSENDDVLQRQIMIDRGIEEDLGGRREFFISLPENELERHARQHRKSKRAISDAGRLAPGTETGFPEEPRGAAELFNKGLRHPPGEDPCVKEPASDVFIPDPFAGQVAAFCMKEVVENDDSGHERNRLLLRSNETQFGKTDNQALAKKVEPEFSPGRISTVNGPRFQRPLQRVHPLEGGSGKIKGLLVVSLLGQFHIGEPHSA